MGKTKSYDLIWEDDSLSITGPPSREIKQALTYTAKRLEPDPRNPWQRVTKKSREKIFFQRDDGNKAIQTLITFQGMLDSVITTIVSFGGKFKLFDNRSKFPSPDYERMWGFRFSQKEMLLTALSKQRSGLVVAPTRYGKTALICNAINAYPGLKTVVLAPGVDLLPQLEDSIRYFCEDREVKGIYTGSRNKLQSEEVTVCSVDSIDKLDYSGTKLVLADEPHTLATGPRSYSLSQFEHARLLGFGATVSGRWEGNDIMLTGLFGPRLVERTYTQAVEEGAICPIHVKFIKIPFRHKPVRTRRSAYNMLLSHKNYLSAINDLHKTVLPQDWQTLFFISNEKQGNKVLEQLDGDGFLAMDKLMKKAGERKEIFEKLKKGEITRCVCSNIYSTGITIDGIRAAVNCAEGGANILSIQKPGRLAEIKPGKKAGYMIDFLFVPENPKDQLDSIPERDKKWKLPVNDCWSRMNAYREKGYDVEIVENAEQLKSKLS